MYTSHFLSYLHAAAPAHFLIYRTRNLKVFSGK